MKVLLIDVNYRHSSTGKIVHDLAHELLSANHQAKVLFGRGEKIDNSIARRVSSVWEVYFHAFMTRLTGLTGIFSYFSTRSVIREIEKFQPDIVHLHELHGYYLNYSKVIDFLKKNKISVIWTFHCEFAYTGKCGHAYDCDKWRTECSSCPQIKEYPASMHFDFTRHMFNKKKNDFLGFKYLTIVTPSNWLARRVKQSFLSSFDVRVIHNGINTDTVFYPRSFSNSDKSQKIILAVAPDIMSERKGGKWVLELAKRFDKSVKFIIVGVIETFVDVPSNVALIQRTNNQDELANYYSQADLFLICSKRENFPTTCLEAISCGTPVIGFDEGGTAETAPGKLGYFSEFGDLDSLEIAIRDYFSGDSPIDASLCRPYAENNYSKQAMCSAYINLYNQVLKEREYNEH
ncbi:glycosyltransferase [Vibrio cholerae]|uniref:glycosyltransferase n=1 Tax=Vibrio cholerae TaxID=666 RepID=UPI0005B4C36F|nr:glycosyltransferase [Vibrio cholerae]TQP44352.1 glycosyltransferase [Vibrio cholerae]